MCTEAGYSFEKGFVSIVDDKEVDIVIPELILPRVLIMVDVQLDNIIRTEHKSAGADRLLYERVRAYNLARGRRQEPNVQLVNVIDGGGWLARRNDLEEMYLHCDYALSFSQLDFLPDILRFHMRIGTK